MGAVAPTTSFFGANRSRQNVDGIVYNCCERRYPTLWDTPWEETPPSNCHSTATQLRLITKKCWNKAQYLATISRQNSVHGREAQKMSNPDRFRAITPFCKGTQLDGSDLPGATRPNLYVAGTNLPPRRSRVTFCCLSIKHYSDQRSA